MPVGEYLPDDLGPDLELDLDLDLGSERDGDSREAIQEALPGGTAVVQSRVTLGVAALAVVGLAAGVRLAVAPLVSDPVHPVTWIGTAGGYLGGGVIAWIIGRGVDVHQSEYLELRALQLAHVVYGALGGAMYPWLYNVVFDYPGRLYVTFPGVLNGTYSWSMIMFVIAGSVYLLVGTIGGVSGQLRQWVGLIATYLVYSLVLGFWLGLSRPVWYPLLGI